LGRGRYERAAEYMHVVKALRDSWSGDAVLDDSASRQYARPSSIRAVNHSGPNYRLSDPFNLPRYPKGRPVCVQAGSSETDRRFAACHAEAVFTAQMEKATDATSYADLKALAAEGRSPDHVLILPGLSPVIGCSKPKHSAEDWFRDGAADGFN
jgi:alkanesulfonate monooxygenase SsuD/methylene tetrahydromethanopterin reductase-like flavin-dependent oxidoreductase (luciferase family)